MRATTVEVMPGITVSARGIAYVAGTRVRASSVYSAFIYRQASIRSLRRRFGVLPWQIEMALRWEARDPDVRLFLLEKARRVARG